MARQAEDKRDHVPARAAEAATTQSLLDRAELTDAARARHGRIRYDSARIALAEGRLKDAMDLLADDNSRSSSRSSS
jgi:hypothetical protein